MKPFSLIAALQFWTKKTDNSVRQNFNFDLYKRILKAKMR